MRKSYSVDKIFINGIRNSHSRALTLLHPNDYFAFRKRDFIFPNDFLALGNAFARFRKPKIARFG